MKEKTVMDEVLELSQRALEFKTSWEKVLERYVRYKQRKAPQETPTEDTELYHEIFEVKPLGVITTILPDKKQKKINSALGFIPNILPGEYTRVYELEVAGRTYEAPLHMLIWNHVIPDAEFRILGLGHTNARRLKKEGDKEAAIDLYNYVLGKKWSVLTMLFQPTPKVLEIIGTDGDTRLGLAAVYMEDNKAAEVVCSCMEDGTLVQLDIRVFQEDDCQEADFGEIAELIASGEEYTIRPKEGSDDGTV